MDIRGRFNPQSISVTELVRAIEPETDAYKLRGIQRKEEIVE